MGMECWAFSAPMNANLVSCPWRRRPPLSEDLRLLLHDPIFLPQPGQLLPLFGRQGARRTLALIDLRLPHPVVKDRPTTSRARLTWATVWPSRNTNRTARALN